MEDVEKIRSRLGMVHVYTGNGKGKTTASLGLALRAMGHGLRVHMVQFMKIGYTGEILFTKRYGVPLDIHSFNVQCKSQAQHDQDIKNGTFKGYCRDCFVPTEYDEPLARKAFEDARKALLSKEFDLVILDEANIVMSKNLIPVKEFIQLINEKPVHTELVLTGRNAPQEILEKADYVTEMTLKRHPYMKKVYARIGIEF